MALTVTGFGAWTPDCRVSARNDRDDTVSGRSGAKRSGVRDTALRDTLKARNRSMAVTSQGNDPPDARPNTIHSSSAPPSSRHQRVRLRVGAFEALQAIKDAPSSATEMVSDTKREARCRQARCGHVRRPESFSLTPRIPADATTRRISGTGSVFSPAQYPPQAAGHEVSFDNLGSVSRCVCWALSWYCR